MDGIRFSSRPVQLSLTKGRLAHLALIRLNLIATRNVQLFQQPDDALRARLFKVLRSMSITRVLQVARLGKCRSPDLVSLLHGLTWRVTGMAGQGEVWVYCCSVPLQSVKAVGRRGSGGQLGLFAIDHESSSLGWTSTGQDSNICTLLRSIQAHSSVCQR